MRILLVNPPYTLEERYGRKLKHFGGNAEPLGLAYLASAVRQDGHHVEIVDGAVGDETPDTIAEKVKREGMDLVGITMLTPMYGAVTKTVAAIRAASPGTVIVTGGAHATALPEETVLDTGCHIAVIGEGEQTFRELAGAVEKGAPLDDVHGICFKADGKLIRTAARQFETDLDRFPPPARDLLPMDRYFLTATRVRGSGYCGTVIVSRGCPFKCSYCSHPFGRTFRTHSPERIISEIEELVNVYKASEINMEADTLTLNRKFILSLCDALIARGIHKKIKWTCESRADTLDEEVLARMREAGCWQISVGIESGVDRLLREIEKGEDTVEIKKKIGLINRMGISVRGFFMLGLPTETREESFETIRFAKGLALDWAQFTITTPYPGTPLFERLKRSGEIGSFQWDNYRTWGGWTEAPIPYVCEGRTAAELKNLQKYAMKSFYLRPVMFLKFFGKIDSWRALTRYLTGLMVLLNIRKK
jgi:anaerobic magnesium-protoporphyrin IX monomethyl ester cyclase